MLLDGLIANDCTDEYLKKLKDLEIRLKEKVSAGHFRFKINDAKVYKQLSEIHGNNTRDELLKMINHSHDTQGVEVMNKSCSANAQKGETFSKTMSLTTRLQVACASQIVGHHVRWTRICASVGLSLGDTLSKYLK